MSTSVRELVYEKMIDYEFLTQGATDEQPSSTVFDAVCTIIFAIKDGESRCNLVVRFDGEEEDVKVEKPFEYWVDRIGQRLCITALWEKGDTAPSKRVVDLLDAFPLVNGTQLHIRNNAIIKDVFIDGPVDYWDSLREKKIRLIGNRKNPAGADRIELNLISATPVENGTNEAGKNEFVIEKGHVTDPEIMKAAWKAMEGDLTDIDCFGPDNDLERPIRSYLPDAHEKHEASSKKAFSISELEKMYKEKKSDIPENIRNEIDRCFESAKSIGGRADKENAKKVLYYLINFTWHTDGQIVDISHVMDTLNNSYVGMSDLKEMFRKELISYNHSIDKKPETILLVGKDGCGKTGFAKAFFEALEKPYELFSVSGLNDPNLILGSGRMYENGQPSELSRKYLLHSRDSGFIIDQIDKADKLCRNALQSFIERRFMDSFLEVELDISKLWIICTASDTKDIEPSLLRNMKVFYVDEYTDAEKEEIINRIFIPRMCEKYSLEWTGETFSKEVIDIILGKYAVSSSLSDIKRIVRNIFISAIERGESFPGIDEYNFDEYHTWTETEMTAKDRFATSISAYKRKVDACASLYPENILKKNREMISMVEYGNDSDKEYALNVLKITANVIKTTVADVDITCLQNELDHSHYGMRHVKNAIIRHIYASTRSDNEKIRAILLNGGAGVGKTSIALAIAKALNRKFVKIALNGVSGSDALKGTGRIYKEAHAGMIVSSLARPDVGTYSPVMLIDELDKVAGWNHGNPYAAFMDLLDGQGGYYDAYIDESIPTDEIFFIFTSNDISKIPEPVLDRMEIINIPGYTELEKRHIAREYMIPRLIRQYRLAEACMSDKMLDQMIRDYCPGNGVRDVEQMLSKLFEEKMLRTKAAEKTCLMFEENDLAEVLGAKAYANSDFPVSSYNAAGLVRALAVSGNAGSSFGIQIVENPYSKKDIEITGLAKGSFMESIKVARTLVSRIIQKKLPPVHIHALSPGIQKDGPSAGVTIFTCMMSYVLNHPVGNIAMTGTIDLFGNVGVIGGEKLKLMAAEKAGVKTVYLPMENYEHLKADGDLELFQTMDIVPITHVGELLDLLFPEFVRDKLMKHSAM